MTANKDLGKTWKKNQFKTRTVEQTDSIVDSVIDQFITRAKFGKDKYNTDLDRTDLGLADWIDHSIEEMMDNILYLQKMKKMLGGKKS